jgi:hypothetical protein
MQMTEQQRLEYKIYRKACAECDIEPVLAEFLAGEITDGVVSIMELGQNEREWERREAIIFNRR